jgi:predicted PurR-regulated permease PerM
MNEQPKQTYIAGLSSPASFTKRVLIIAAVVALALILWRLSHILILVFAGVVVAMVLRALAEPLAQRTGLGQRWALAIVVVALLGLVALGAWFFGARIAEQFDQIVQRVPQAWGNVRGWLEKHQAGRYVLESLSTSFVGADKAPASFARFFTGTFGAIGDAVVILVVGLYLAAEPGVYRRGIVKLTPPSVRPRLESAFDAIRDALKRWLLGQALAMLAVGTVIGIGLWMLGMPMALGLGILAGILEFVPYIGPFLAAVPALLIALAQEPMLALYTALLYWGVQQVENWALIPIIEKWSVELPPVLAILSLVIFGVLFGVPGVIVAAPLMIVVMILVRKLYIEGILEDKA